MSHLTTLTAPAAPVVSSPSASSTIAAAPLPSWKPWQRVLFRFAFFTIATLIVPLTSEWWEKLYNLKAVSGLYSLLTTQRAEFIRLESESGKWGLGGFAPWGVAALVGVVGAAIWTLFARRSRRTEYNTLYYWLRLVVRYRIALGLLAFGFMKVFPEQMPYPSRANFDTNLGDFTAYKLYWEHVGIVPWYEVILGLVEVGSAVLFFFRGTTALGAVIVTGVLYNISHANFAYDGGVHVYSGFFVLLSAFLLIPYVPNIWRLLILRRDVVPHYHYPSLVHRGYRWTHYGMKVALVLVFTVVYGYTRYEGYHTEGFRKEPRTPSPAGFEGTYDVTEFRLNGRVLPYSPLDPVRWHEAVFERYTTFSYTVRRAFPIYLSNGAPALRDAEKRYELSGIAGGRRYFYYVADPAKGTLVLQDKNNDDDAIAGKRRPRATDGSEKEKNVRKFTWRFSHPSDTRVILTGKDEEKNDLYVVLDRRRSTYAIEHSPDGVLPVLSSPATVAGR